MKNMYVVWMHVLCPTVIGCTGKRHSKFIWKHFIQLIRCSTFTETSHFECTWSWLRWKCNETYLGVKRIFNIVFFIYLKLSWHPQYVTFFLSGLTFSANFMLAIVHTTEGAISVDNLTNSANFGTWPSLFTTFSIGFDCLSSSGMTLSAICLTISPSLFT